MFDCFGYPSPSVNWQIPSINLDHDKGNFPVIRCRCRPHSRHQFQHGGVSSHIQFYGITRGGLQNPLGFCHVKDAKLELSSSRTALVLVQSRNMGCSPYAGQFE